LSETYLEENLSCSNESSVKHDTTKGDLVACAFVYFHSNTSKSLETKETLRNPEDDPEENGFCYTIFSIEIDQTTISICKYNLND